MSKVPVRWQWIWTLLVVSLVLLFAVVVGWSRLGAASPAPAATGAGPQQVASVNSVAITQAMIDRELKISRLNVAAPLSALTGEALVVAQEEALNQLISRQVVLQAASRQGFSLDAAAVQERADLLYGSNSPAEIEQALTEIGATQEDLLWWVKEIFTAEEFTTDVLLADVAPDLRQEYYNKWYNQRRAEAQIQIFADGDAPRPQALVGEVAPNFTLITPDGVPISLSDYQGRVVLINFWATWCPSCVTEMPDYEQVYREYTPEFVVLGINLQESPDHVAQYAAGLGLSFPVLVDQDGQVTNRHYRVTGMPGSFIIDRQGAIVYRHVGPMQAQTLRSKLAELGL